MSTSSLRYRHRPGIRALCDEASSSLVHGRVVFLLIPGFPDIQHLAKLVTNDFDPKLVQFVSLEQLDAADPAQSLKQRFRISNSLPGAPSRLCAISTWPQILVLEDLQNLPAPAQSAWCDFAARWAREVMAGDHYRKTLFFPVSGGDIAGLPTELPTVAVLKYWGEQSRLSYLEGHMHVCLDDRPEQHPDLPACLTWKHIVYPDVAGADIVLLSQLMDHHELGFDELVETLRHYAQGRGWTKALLWEAGAALAMDQGFLERMAPESDPPDSLTRLWHMGALAWSAEHGAEIHAAAAAILNRLDLVEHRIWRGQVRTILPVLDAVRRHAWRHLTRVHPELQPEKRPLAGSLRPPGYRELLRYFGDAAQGEGRYGLLQAFTTVLMSTEQLMDFRILTCAGLHELTAAVGCVERGVSALTL